MIKTDCKQDLEYQIKHEILLIKHLERLESRGYHVELVQNQFDVECLNTALYEDYSYYFRLWEGEDILALWGCFKPYLESKLYLHELCI